MKPLEVNDANAMTDHRKPLVRALKVASWALVVLTVVALMGWCVGGTTTQVKPTLRGRPVRITAGLVPSRY